MSLAPQDREWSPVALRYMSDHDAVSRGSLKDHWTSGVLTLVRA